MVADALLATELCQKKIDGGLITQLAEDILVCKSALKPLGLTGLKGFAPLNKVFSIVRGEGCSGVGV
jgi:hypothetical protein